MNELQALIALLSVDGVGPRRCARLLSKFYTAEGVLHASYDDLLHVEDIGENTAKSILSARNYFSDAEKILEAVEKRGYDIITYYSPEYPPPLKEIADAPILLYRTGPLRPDWTKSIAIVGSRLATEYGKKVAYQLAEEFSASGWAVVSGMAVGIDGAAHRGALAGLVGGTAGVLGCGLDVEYPPQHRTLFAELREQGLLLSEYPPAVQPDARFFPQRNRIISGITRGTIVVEAREKSGALLTADSALEQNRDLFAVPGMITAPMSRGPHRLIQNGAKLITCASDVLNEYDQALRAKPQPLVHRGELTGLEAVLYQRLEGSALSADFLAERSGAGIGEVLAALTAMQLKGLVVQSGGEYHCVGR
ncbi:MAG: DNA-processing protein DprA [bacterium]|nr:DNA-processing protein DprA [bacterium]